MFKYKLPENKIIIECALYLENAPSSEHEYHMFCDTLRNMVETSFPKTKKGRFDFFYDGGGIVKCRSLVSLSDISKDDDESKQNLQGISRKRKRVRR